MIGRRVGLGIGFLASAALAGACGGPAPNGFETVRSAANSSVVVVVRDSLNAPLAGIEVAALRSGQEVSYGITDGNGQATFSLPGPNTYQFDASVDNSDFLSGTCAVPNTCTTAQITIPRVDVTVVDTSGTPLYRHLISWEAPAGAAGGFVETDPNGHAVIAEPAGSYRFIDEVNGFVFASGTAGHCTVPSPCTAVTITETPPVTVTVRDASGAPQNGLPVGWQDTGGAEGGFPQTQPDGTAVLSVPAGSITFNTVVAGLTFSSTPACVVPGCTAAAITVSTPIVVTVKDTAGVAISGQSVRWEDAAGNTGGATTTNGAGQATLRPPLVPVRFRVAVDNTTFYSGAAGHCVQPACSTAAITVSQQTIVTLLDGSGNPVASRAVTPTAVEAGLTSANKTTNASGQATFRLPIGHWRFSAKCSGNNETFYSGDAGNCDVSGSACLTSQIRMPCGTCAGRTSGACDDQNPCSGTSTCNSNGFCIGSSPMTCSASDQCHNAGACRAATGTCSNPPKADSSSCNDGNACTQTDSCLAGVCTGANPKTCIALDQCHVAGTCDSSTGVCTNPNKTNGAACDDGSSCTGADTCQSGSCQGPVSNPACIPPAWVTDARQAGLLPASYLTPTFYQPIGDPANIDINDPTVETHLAGVTSSGIVAGTTALFIPTWPDLAPASPFVVDGTGQHLLANPWPGGNAYATGLTEAGEVLVWGTDSAQRRYHSAFFHPDRSYDLVPVPTDVRMEMLNNVHGTTGWPTMLGSSPNHGARAGTLGVWHLDRDFNDAVGPSHLPALANPVWVAGHPGAEAGGALSFDGATCLMGPSGEDTALHDYDLSTGLTMMAWVNPDPTLCAAGGTHVIFSRGLEYELALQCNTDGTSSVTSSMRLSAADYGVFQAPAGVVQPGQWSHVAVTWDHKTLQTYVNGSLVGSQARPGAVTNVALDSVWIGCSNRGAATNFKGAIDEVAAFRNGMGADQIDLYRRNVSNYPPYTQTAAVFRYKDGFLDAILPATGAPYSSNESYFGPLGLNDQGIFTASRTLANGSSSAMLYDPASGWLDLNGRLPPDSGWNLQYAYGLSNNGFVVGRGLHDGVQAGYRLNLNTNAIVDVGRLDGVWGASDLYVYDLSVNDAGVVGGAVYDNIPYWQTQAFVYTDELGIFDPNWLIDPRAGWVLVNAGVNNQGIAVGWAIGANDTKRRGFSLALPILPSRGQVACAGKAEGASCDDRDACTNGDTCRSGVCRGDAVVCAAPAACHLPGTCNSATGACSAPIAPDGTTCDDHLACTQSEICQAGSCQPPPNKPVVLNRAVTVVGAAVGSQANAGRINAAGQIVGVATSGGVSHGFLQSGPAAAVDLGVPAGFSATVASSINDQAVVTGTLTTSGGSSHVFRYDAASGIHDLGSFGDDSEAIEFAGFPGTHGTVGYDINNAGQIVGYFTSAGVIHGYRYMEGVGFEDVGSLAGGRTSLGAIRDDGTAFGSSWVPGTPTGTFGPERLGHAVMYQDAIGLVDLNVHFDVGGWTLYNVLDAAGDYIVGTGTLDGHQKAYRLNLRTGVLDDMSGGWQGFTYANGVNAAGDVAAFGYTDAANTRQEAYVYTERLGFKKLNDIIDPASGWDLHVANSINDAQEIVGWGYKDGQVGAFRVQIPTPEVAVCEARGSVCGPGADTDSICLLNDGIVDMGGGTYVAVFGYDNAGASTMPTDNVVLINDTEVTHFSPAPPGVFATGIHEGAFLPRFTGGKIAWRVNGETVSVTLSDPNVRHLNPVQIGTNGVGVIIQGHLIVIKPDLAPYETPPSDPTAYAPSDPETGAEFFGALEGSLSVGATGAAVYTVPIAIPPGIAGMAPNLSLVYNSQGGDGIAGQGWDLAGLSTIYRCPKNWAQDGVAQPVALRDDLDPRDGICLDGKRLLERSDGTYFLEQDPFTTITRLEDAPDPNIVKTDLKRVFFKVTTKTGEGRYYGSSPANRATVTTSQSITMWPLDKVVDQWGNYYDIQYTVDYDDDASRTLADLRVANIKYTGHLASFGTPGADPAHPENDDDTVTPAVEPFNTVIFGYEDNRPDPRQSRIGTQVFRRTHRLTTITTPLGVYTLAYSPYVDPMLPSQLASISYEAAGVPLQALSFDWDGGGYRWEQHDEYAPPRRLDYSYDGDKPLTHGTQFVDLDGDGLVDFVESFATSRHTWRNTGHNWEEKALWALPAPLVNLLGYSQGVTFADVDGDGLPDLIAGFPRSPAGISIEGCTSGGFCDDMKVWLNRLRTDAGDWEESPGFESFPSSWHGGGNTRGIVADMNGDGRADLVRMGPGDYEIQVLYSNGSGWTESPENFDLDEFVEYAGPTISQQYHYRLEDVNRDGFPDLVPNYDEPFCTAFMLGINMGRNDARGFVWDAQRAPACPNPGTPIDQHLHPGQMVTGDIDGDGTRDRLTYFRLTTTSSFGVRSYHVDSAPQLFFASGPTYTALGATTYLDDLPQPHTPQSNGLFTDEAIAREFLFNMTDLNGDGLADAIVNHADGGQLLVNTGAHFADLFGRTGWQQSAGAVVEKRVPFVPTSLNGFTDTGADFVDLDGDGLTDLVQANGDGAHAWLNRFHPPVIIHFPNGLARKTEIKYSVITTEQAHIDGTYSDRNSLDDFTRFFSAPLRVVASVFAEDGTGTNTLFETKYSYQNLRVSSEGRGPLGFEFVTTTNTASQEVTTTQYRQAYPYTGMPRYVTRQRAGTVLGTTTTIYCDTVDETQCSSQSGRSSLPVSAASFIRPLTVYDTASVWSDAGPDIILTTSAFHYDAKGNPKDTKVTASKCASAVDILTLCASGETNVKETVNQYLPGSAEEKMGKPAVTTVTAQRTFPLDGNNLPLTHTTAFDYATVESISPLFPSDTPISALALRKTRVEPNAPTTQVVSPTVSLEQNAEVHTIYRYDAFGNVITTTVCASVFESCATGAAGPATLPYRTTRVSYSPQDFHPNPGEGVITTLAYQQKGRFPVRTTNALGQHEYSVYDPVRGVLLQKTAINGLHTRYDYDPFGRQISQTVGFASAKPLTTTTHEYLSAAPDLPNARTVTVTRPPDGATTWAYSDCLGKVVATRSREFDGAFVETSTTYDSLGRPAYQAKPHVAGAQDVYTTFRHFDDLGRNDYVTDQLGSIDESTNKVETTTTVSFQGLTTITTDGLQHARTEVKNVLGKVESVTDANNKTIRYHYDADGNLTETIDPLGNSVVLHYDLRGRKNMTIDPDLGPWSYVFNGFGELIRQTDAKEQTTTIDHDVLGRIVGKTDSSGTSTWIYDSAPGNGIGQLAAMVGPVDERLTGTCTPPYGAPSGVRPARWFTYDELGDLDSAVDCVDGEQFTTGHTYDAIRRPSVLTYPAVGGSAFQARYHHTRFGFLQYIDDPTAENSVLWAATEMDAAGHVTTERTRNGVETRSFINPSTGWLMGRGTQSYANADLVIQGWSYAYDVGGNLRIRDRADDVAGAHSSEAFFYDSLNRLSTATTFNSGYAHFQTYGYDDVGNLTNKDGTALHYSGCGAGPHAACTSGDNGYTYDANGNMTAGAGRTVRYNASNKVTHIGSDSAAADFVYGADGSRVVQIATAGSTTPNRTVYVGLGDTGKSLYERTTGAGGTEHVHFVYAGNVHNGNAFALRVTQQTSGASSTTSKYYHYDHLGSVTAMSDDAGRVMANGGVDASVFGYDPWGARRDPDGRAADPSSFELQPGHREFTGHETIPGVGLINMNGRVYDPTIGRFLSPDPNVQFVADLQSFNRYSYVLNNPLRYTDPTGYFLGIDSGMFKAMLPIAGMALCAAGGPEVCVGVMIFSTWNSALTMSMSGASFSQVVATTAIGIGAGWVGGQAAGAIGSATVARGVIGALLSGVISGSMSAALTAPLFGRELGSGWLESAMMGAAGAAEGIAIAGVIQASQASVPEVGGESEVHEEGGWGGEHRQSDDAPSSSGGKNYRSQEKAQSCVPASTRNAIIWRTGTDIPESQIREEMDPDKRHDWNTRGIQPTEVVRVLQSHGVNASEINVTSVDDIIKVTQHGSLMVGGNKSGEPHRIVLMGTATRGDTRMFWVIDPSAEVGLGKQIRPQAWTMDQFKNFWDKGQPVIKL